MIYEAQRAARAAERRCRTTVTWGTHDQRELGPFGGEGMALAWQLTVNAWAFAGRPLPDPGVMRTHWRFVPRGED